MPEKIIGILTFHDGINHGAYLQVYSLSNYIKRCGLIVEIINYKNPQHWFNEYRCVLRTKNPYLFLRMLHKLINFKKSQSLLPIGRFIIGSNKIGYKRYDTIVVGSDEIWNFKQPIVGYDLTYFGKNLNTERLISYAASFGAVNHEGAAIPGEISSLILKFDKISVRDSNSLSIVEKIGRKDAEMVVDPVFLINLPYNTNNIREKDFILVYTTALPLDLQEEVRSYAKKVGKKLISIGYMNRWCDINIIAIDPFAWLGYFHKASYVITSMFHGTMISIKYEKQFCTLVDSYRTNKFRGVMDKLELTNRIKEQGMSIEKIFDKNIDYSRVKELLNPFIEDSKGYINRALL